MYQQPPIPPGAPPPRNSAVTPIVLGCTAVLVVFLILGGVAAWFAWHAIGGALKTASDVQRVAQGAVDSAQQSAAQAGASPSADQAAAAGVAALKSLVGGGQKHVEPLSRDELKTYLPASVGSLARTSSDSSSGTVAGITGTNATANYGDATNGTVQIDLTDAANMTGLTALMDLMMGAVQNENDEGYEKTTDLGDIKVHEKWENSGKHAELIGIVGGRFFIQVTSNGVDMPTAEQAFQAVDTAKLANVAASAPHQ